jgi:hypothetical protein
LLTFLLTLQIDPSKGTACSDKGLFQFLCTRRAHCLVAGNLVMTLIEPPTHPIQGRCYEIGVPLTFLTLLRSRSLVAFILYVPSCQSRTTRSVLYRLRGTSLVAALHSFASRMPPDFLMDVAHLPKAFKKKSSRMETATWLTRRLVSLRRPGGTRDLSHAEPRSVQTPPIWTSPLCEDESRVLGDNVEFSPGAVRSFYRPEAV